MLKIISALVSGHISIMAFVGCIGCGASDPLGTDFSGSVDGQYVEHLDRTLDGGGASRLDAQTTNGAIILDGTPGDQVVVQIRKEIRAKSKEEATAFARKVQVYVERNGNEILIYKEHPRPPGHVQVMVSYEIQSPSGVDVKVSTVNGEIRIRGIEGTVDAGAVNGTVDLRGEPDRVDLHLVNGNIVASVETLGGAGRFLTVNGSIDVEIRTGVVPVSATATNGSVEVTLPAGFSGQLDARTAGGQIDCDFPVRRPTGSPKNRLVGPLGGGGNTLVRLYTANGNVYLKSRS